MKPRVVCRAHPVAASQLDTGDILRGEKGFEDDAQHGA